jgi:hypothetical protein
MVILGVVAELFKVGDGGGDDIMTEFRFEGTAPLFDWLVGDMSTTGFPQLLSPNFDITPPITDAGLTMEQVNGK